MNNSFIAMKYKWMEKVFNKQKLVLP